MSRKNIWRTLKRKITKKILEIEDEWGFGSTFFILAGICFATLTLCVSIGWQKGKIISAMGAFAFLTIGGGAKLIQYYMEEK